MLNIVECNHVKLLKCCNFVVFVAVIDRFEVLAADYLVFVSGAVVIVYAVEFGEFVVELVAEQGQCFSDLDLESLQTYHYV